MSKRSGTSSVGKGPFNSGWKQVGTKSASGSGIPLYGWTGASRSCKSSPFPNSSDISSKPIRKSK